MWAPSTPFLQVAGEGAQCAAMHGHAETGGLAGGDRVQGAIHGRDDGNLSLDEVENGAKFHIRPHELEIISVNDLAEKAGTISYEMVCAVSQRVPRVYIL